MSKYHYIVTGSPEDPKARIGVSLDGRFRQFLLSSDQGTKLHAAVKAGADLEEVRLIASVEAWAVAKNFDIAGKTLVLDDRDQLRLNGKIVDYGLTDIIKRMAEAGEDILPLVNFMERAERNPNKSVANDLYRFLSKGVLLITPEGCFHAYKRVQADFMSVHSGYEPTWTQLDGDDAVEATGRTHYPIGSTVWMKRADCDENRDRTCSRGLHACSFDYLQSFSGQNVIDVIIDPEDVTAIPSDYNDAKLRCCKLRVVAHIPDDDVKEYFSHVVDRRHPALVTKPADSVVGGDPENTTSETDWQVVGKEAGEIAGKSDRENDWDYDPTPEYPLEISLDNEARKVFSQGFYEGYGVGWSTVVEDDLDDSDALDALDDSDPEITVEEAKAWGAEDGAGAAQSDSDNDYGYDNDPSEGDRHSELAGYGDRDYEDGADTAYDIAFHAAYSAKWQELNP